MTHIISIGGAPREPDADFAIPIRREIGIHKSIVIIPNLPLRDLLKFDVLISTTSTCAFLKFVLLRFQANHTSVLVRRVAPVIALPGQPNEQLSTPSGAFRVIVPLGQLSISISREEYWFEPSAIEKTRS